jgi:hypothetical protein
MPSGSVEGTKNERSLGLDRDVAKEQLDRAETFKVIDEGLYSRHEIIESPIPRGAVFEKDGKRVVYRREGGSFVPVEITIGRQSISRVVLASGVSAGDLIALHDPTAKRALGPSLSGGAEAGK